MAAQAKQFKAECHLWHNVKLYGVFGNLTAKVLYCFVLVGFSAAASTFVDHH